ncbi:MAG: methyltransferase domain-containing protein [Pseudomonadota bacterium]|nr:methyltransferase domain-containing protein [Pseudomonadota bacterium]
MPGFSDFAELERKGWSEPNTAGAYARDFAAAADMCIPALVAAVESKPGMRIADICCGHGMIAQALAATGAEVIGVDFSPAMLELARANAPEARFVEGDAMALDLADDSLDAVTIGFGIPHVPEPETVFGEVKRVLRDGGRFAYTVWHGMEVDGAFRWLFEAVRRHGDPDISLPPAPDANAYGLREVAFPALEAASFRDMAVQTVDSHWVSDNPAAPYAFFRDGTVRGAALLRGQPEPRKRAIRQAVVDDVMRCCGRTKPYRIPIPAVLVSARA